MRSFISSLKAVVATEPLICFFFRIHWTIENKGSNRKSSLFTIFRFRELSIIQMITSKCFRAIQCSVWQHQTTVILIISMRWLFGTHWWFISHFTALRVLKCIIFAPEICAFLNSPWRFNECKLFDLRIYLIMQLKKRIESFMKSLTS